MTLYLVKLHVYCTIVGLHARRELARTPLDLDLDLDLLYGPNPTDYPRTSANVGATKRRAE